MKKMRLRTAALVIALCLLMATAGPQTASAGCTWEVATSQQVSCGFNSEGGSCDAGTYKTTAPCSSSDEGCYDRDWVSVFPCPSGCTGGHDLFAYVCSAAGCSCP
jgi:hypothetical protein